MPESVLEKTGVDHRWFTLRLGFVPILDYTWFPQDEESVGLWLETLLPNGLDLATRR